MELILETFSSKYFEKMFACVTFHLTTIVRLNFQCLKCELLIQNEILPMAIRILHSNNRIEARFRVRYFHFHGDT